MRTRTFLPLAILSALLLAACTGAGGGTARAPGGDPSARSNRDGLEGRTFLATAAVGHSLVPGSVVRLSFEDGRLGAAGGCNSMGGSYAIDGGRLSVGQLAMTEMACEQALMDQDQWLAALLDGAEITLAGDTLTLAKAGARLSLLDREIAEPDLPLVGTRWVVDGLVSADAVASVPVGLAAALTFHAGGVAVEAGCNQGGGSVTVTDGTISFGPIALTKMACDASAMDVERAVSAVLSGEVRYVIEARTLRLDAGPAGLILRAAP
jgi:heat shock protein HslJ